VSHGSGHERRFAGLRNKEAISLFLPFPGLKSRDCTCRQGCPGVTPVALVPFEKSYWRSGWRPINAGGSVSIFPADGRCARGPADRCPGGNAQAMVLSNDPEGCGCLRGSGLIPRPLQSVYCQFGRPSSATSHARPTNVGYQNERREWFCVAGRRDSAMGSHLPR